jgi:PQQ-dependent dehydrogenase (s-GDH family)
MKADTMGRVVSRQNEVTGGKRLQAAGVLCAVVLTAATLLAQNPRTRHHLGGERFTSRTLVGNLENPWEIAWGPDNYLWVTERTAFRVTRINPSDGTRRLAVAIADGYQSVVQDGLLGLALHPDLLKGAGADFVFVAYTYDRDAGPALDRRLRVRRYTYHRDRQILDSPADVIDGLSAHDDHGGGRMTIGPDRKLYLSRGDNGSNWLANYCNRIRSQDLPTADEIRARDWTNYQGKLLRLNLDGSVPADNPMFGGVRSHVYATGLRNVQGMVFGPGGRLFASEHGPTTDDELNVIEAGRNYGWPYVAGYKDDRAYAYFNWSGSAPAPCRSLKFERVGAPASVPRLRESEWNDPSFAPPLTTFFTVATDYDTAALGAATIAPAGIDVYASPAIPGWATSILITGMRTGGVYRVKLDAAGGASDGEVREYFRSADRYRDVAVSPDGMRVYLATDNFGTTMAPDDRSTSRLAHPGSIVEFRYAPPAPKP